MKRKPILALVVLVLVAAIAGVAYWRLRPTTTTTAATSSQTATVTRGSLSATVNAAGNIASQQTAALTFGQSGTVKKIDVKVGSHVKAGDVLAELETADLELQLRSSQVSLKNTENSLAQVKSPRDRA